MSFLSHAIDAITHKGQHEQSQQQNYGNQGYGSGYQNNNQYGGGYGGPPPPPAPPALSHPFVAEWEVQSSRFVFINTNNGYRSYEYPGPGPQPVPGGPAYRGNYGQQSGPGQYGGGYGAPQQGYPPQGSAHNDTHGKKSGGHGMAYAAGGAAVGVLGGMALAHEGEKIEDRFDEDRYRPEQNIQNDEYGAAQWAGQKVQDVEDFPEDAARWTGQKVQEVEDIPQDIENKWDNAVDDVEDAPEEIAGWAGRKVGEVENFGDNIQDAYDDGRDEERVDDDYDNDDGGDW